MACGFELQHGVNFQEIFAPTIRWESIRLMDGLAAYHRWSIYHLDVTTAFLNDFIEEDIYMVQPPCAILGTEHLVYKLKQSLWAQTEPTSMV